MLVGLFVMSAAIVYTVIIPVDLTTEHSFGFAFVLAWLAFPLTLISGLIYIVLRKTEWRSSGEPSTVITEHVHRPKWPSPTGLYNNAKCKTLQKWQIMKIQINDDSMRISLWLVILFISLLHSSCTYECWNLVHEGPYFEVDHKEDNIKIILILVCLTSYLVSNRSSFLNSNFTLIV